MPRNLVLTVAAIALTALIAIGDADAKRLGGGRSLGAQRQSLAPPATAPGPAANPVMPTPPAAAAARAGAAPASAPGGASRWLGPIAGIAAGLGLAALLSHFGLPEGFASILLLCLVAFGAVIAFRMLFARRWGAAAALPGAGIVSADSANRTPTRVEPVLLPSQPAPLATNFAKPLPAGFDAAGFLREAKVQFRRLQAAWDAGDRKALAAVMTPAMADEIGRDLDARGPHDATRIDSLDAQILAVTTEADFHWASVRFAGLVREDGAAPVSLDEIWNLQKPVDGSTGWLLAGIRQAA